MTTAGEAGRLLVTVLGMVADMEANFIRSRQRAGIEAAKKRGVYKGRPRTTDADEIRRRVAAGTSKTQVARDLGISRMTVYRALEVPEGGEETAPDLAD